MLDKNFDLFYNTRGLRYMCPPAPCAQRNDCENRNDPAYKSAITCRKCWREYIEQQEPDEEIDEQPEYRKELYKGQIKPFKLKPDVLYY